MAGVEQMSAVLVQSERPTRRAQTVRAALDPDAKGDQRALTHVNDSTPSRKRKSARVDYHAYLASREWALLKKQVRARSGGLCERCGAAQQATHHLTYERLGQERLEDLQAVCNPCHEYLSAARDDDPAAVESDTERLLRMGRLLSWIEDLADNWDGKVTLLRDSTTGWQVLLGVPELQEHVLYSLSQEPVHPTLVDALTWYAESWGLDPYSASDD